MQGRLLGMLVGMVLGVIPGVAMFLIALGTTSGFEDQKGLGLGLFGLLLAVLGFIVGAVVGFKAAFATSHETVAAVDAYGERSGRVRSPPITPHRR